MVYHKTFHIINSFYTSYWAALESFFPQTAIFYKIFLKGFKLIIQWVIENLYKPNYNIRTNRGIDMFGIFHAN